MRAPRPVAVRDRYSALAPADAAAPIDLWAFVRARFPPDHPLYLKGLRFENERRHLKHLLRCPRLARVN